MMVRQSLANSVAGLALAALLAAPALAAPDVRQTDVPQTNDCLRPTARPLLPDGTFATHYQIERARDSVFRYKTALHDYRSCLQRRVDTAPASVAMARKQDWLSGITASMTEERSIDQDFADQLTKFRMR